MSSPEHFDMQFAVESSNDLAAMRADELRDESNHPKYRIGEKSPDRPQYDSFIEELRSILSDRLGGTEVPIHDVEAIFKIIASSHVKLCRNLAESIVDELFAVENLFASHGIALSLFELSRAITDHGYVYWEEFFYGEEFDSFRAKGGGYVKAAVKRKIDARGLLSSSLERASELEKDPEFEDCKLAPSSFFIASFYHIDKAADFLRRVITETDKILSEEEFSRFSDQKGLVISYVVSSIKFARNYLRNYNPSRVVIGGYSKTESDEGLVEEVSELRIDVQVATMDAMAQLGKDVERARELSSGEPTLEIREELQQLIDRLSAFTKVLEEDAD